MTRFIVAASFAALVGLGLPGCDGAGAGPYSAGTVTAAANDPNCGVFGTCAPGEARRFRPSDFQASGF